MLSNDFVGQITYPSLTNSETDDFSFDKSKLPVVVLIGWVGSKDKHLAKYGSIYENNGCITVRCTATVAALTFRLDRLPNVAKSFLDLLQDESLDEHPMVFHIFSGGGVLFYQYLKMEMRKQKKTFKIKGEIFDSALGRRRFYSVYLALRSIIGGPVYCNVPITIVATAALSAYYALWPFIEALMEFKMPESIDVNLEEEPSDWPQLLIYSKSDELNKWQDVEKFAWSREEKGVQVTRLCLENSPHVQHLMTHRDIYISTVLHFIKTCFNDNQVWSRL